MLDLSKDQDALLLSMRRETRREIKLALQSGICVREGNRKDLGILFRLMSVVAKRRGEPPTPNNIEVFNVIWDNFHPKGYVKLLVAELAGKPISAGLIFTFGDTVRFWKYGWSGEEERKYPNHLLYWELIRWSRNNGFRYFDIVQVDSAVTDHLSLGLAVTDELKSRRLYGPTLFKTGFGGTVRKFSGPWFRFKNPVARRVYSHIGQRIISTPWIRRFISNIF